MSTGLQWPTSKQNDTNNHKIICVVQAISYAYLGMTGITLNTGNIYYKQLPFVYVRPNNILAVTH